jgi:hypothetical protein
MLVEFRGLRRHGKAPQPLLRHPAWLHPEDPEVETMKRLRAETAALNALLPAVLDAVFKGRL